MVKMNKLECDYDELLKPITNLIRIQAEIEKMIGL